MLSLKKVAPQLIRDLLKRASREFALGFISKSQLDDVVEHADAILQIADQVGSSVKSEK